VSIHTLAAHELAARLARREISSVEIVRALFARIDELDAGVVGYVHVRREEALAEAERADEARARGEATGALHGLPISVKESVDVAGLPSTLGMRARRDRIAARDAVVVRLARAEGAIVLGKTNVPQTLLSPMETTNHLWGTSRNPWNRDRATGGSSGGEGVVLASGTSVLGIGTDLGGSIRLPAAFCGVAGLKPTAYRWSNVGSNTAIAGQEVFRSQIGPMARTAADVAMLLRALDSPKHSAFDPFVAPAPIGDPAAVDVARLRIGVYDDDGVVAAAPAVRRAVREAADGLRGAGATVVDFRPPNGDEPVFLVFRVAGSDGLATLARSLGGEPVIDPISLLWRMGRLPRPIRKTVAALLRARGEPRVARIVEAGGRKGVDDLWAMTARRARLQIEEQEAWTAAGIDAVVCPAHATTAGPHGTSKDFTLGFSYAARYNMLNLPAGVVPVTRVRPDEARPRQGATDRIDRRASQIDAASAGLPVAVQVVARPWREDVVLAVMSAVEAAARGARDFPATPIDPR
jgi:fatty acid amide hydrolase